MATNCCICVDLGFLYRIWPKIELYLIFKRRVMSSPSAFKIVPLNCHCISKLYVYVQALDFISRCYVALLLLFSFHSLLTTSEPPETSCVKTGTQILLPSTTFRPALRPNQLAPSSVVTRSSFPSWRGNLTVHSILVLK